MTKTLPDAVVLVVEDDRMSIEILARMLPRVPVSRVLKAGDGVDAIAQIDRIDGNIDAAILDFSMPRMHGLQLLKKIRTGETSAPAGLPCMMLTGHQDARLFGLAMSLAANAFVQKPVTFDKLKHHLERIIQQGAAQVAPAVYRNVAVEAPVDEILNRIATTQATNSDEGHDSGKELALADDIPLRSVLGNDVIGRAGQTILRAGTVLEAPTLALLRNLAEIDGSIKTIRIR